MRIEQVGGVTIVQGDAIESLQLLDDQSLNCCVTSPPYFGLRDYGEAGQIGLEPTPDEYVAKLVAVFREVKRVLRDDGTLWLNLGDTYARNPAKGQHKPGDSGKQAYVYDKGNGRASSTVLAGLMEKNLLGIPWRVVFALQADGWYLRQDIIWHKPNPMPESVRDRCTKSHEYIFLLSKSAKYYFDSEAMQESAVKGASGSEFHTGKTGEHQLGRASAKPRTAGNKSHKYVTAYDQSDSEEHRLEAGLMKIADTPWETRNKRDVWNVDEDEWSQFQAWKAMQEPEQHDVWEVSTRPYKGAHFAVFPPKLIEPCILAGCPVGGLVLDPFAGSGTTGMVAQQHGRQAVLLELNPSYVDLAVARVAAYAND